MKLRFFSLMRNCLLRTHKMIWYYAPVATKQRDVSVSRLQRMHPTFSKSRRFPMQYRNSVIHCVSKNVPPLACYNFDAHEWSLIFFGRNVTDKVGNQKTLYHATWNTLWLLHYLEKRGNTKITYFTQLDCVTRTMHLCAIFLKEKIVICDVFDSV